MKVVVSPGCVVRQTIFTMRRLLVIGIQLGRRKARAFRDARSRFKSSRTNFARSWCATLGFAFKRVKFLRIDGQTGGSLPGLRPAWHAQMAVTITCLLSVSGQAIEWPLVANVGGRTNVLEGGIKADAIWASDGVKEVTAMVAADSNSYTLGNPGFSTPNLVAARVLASGRWGQIHPMLIEEDSIVNGRPTNPGLQAFGFSGAIKSGESFKIPLPGGSHRWRLEVVANRLGSKLDPVVRVVNRFGKLMATMDDSPGCGRDSWFDFSAGNNGENTIEISDAANAGGDDYFFWLRISADKAFDRYSCPMKSVSENSGPTAKIDDPSNNPEAATMIELPFAASERFERAGDIDWFQFSVRAGEKIVAQAATREIGSSCDAGIALYDTHGTLVSESVGADSAGASITNRFEQAGTFRIRVREISKLGGSNYWYALTIRDFAPGVLLTTDVERIAFNKEGEAKLKINCQRFDYDGAVRLEADSLPDGVTFEQAELPAKKNDVELKLKIQKNKNVPAFQARFSGKMEAKESNQAPPKFRVSTMPALRKLYPLQMFPNAAMDGWIAVNPSE